MTPRTARDAQFDPQVGDTWTDHDNGHVWAVVERYMHGGVDVLGLRTRTGGTFTMAVRVWSADDGGVYTPAP